MEIATSILNVKEAESIKTFYRLEIAHTDYFHIDVMDGNFVKNNTIELMERYADSLKNITNIPLDIHLMVKDIKKYVDEFASCMPRNITFHIEATENKEEAIQLIKYIKEQDCKVGIAVNPETDITEIYDLIPLVHNVMIMTVEPGKGGQTFITDMTKKIAKLKSYITDNNLDTEIEVDGGINLDNIQEVKNAGADIAVVGTFLINSKDYKDTINKLKI
ncbi:ribulose-phosphate 3-epimerase [Clostridium sp. CAG:793]|nr:ribulose-phosphate 3-epimerase [Clostridium sp. CAG:793]